MIVLIFQVKKFMPRSFLARVGMDMVREYEMVKIHAVNSYILLNFVDVSCLAQLTRVRNSSGNTLIVVQNVKKLR